MQESYPFVPGLGPFKKGTTPIVTFTLDGEYYGFYLTGKETLEWLEMLKDAYINKRTFLAVASDPDGPALHVTTCGDFNGRGECVRLADQDWVRPVFRMRYYVIPQ